MGNPRGVRLSDANDMEIDTIKDQTLVPNSVRYDGSKFSFEVIVH